MVLTREERMCPPYRLNRPGGGDTSTWKKDLARSAEAAGGFSGLVITSSNADAAYRDLVPEDLRYTAEQWKYSGPMAQGAMLANAPRNEKELSLIVHKRKPDGQPGAVWRVSRHKLRDDEEAWMVEARAALGRMRAHAVANAATILARYGGKLMSDEELAEFETCPSEDEDAGAAKENAGSARNKPAPKAAAAKKAPSKKREREAAAAASASDEDDDFVRDEPKRKSVKKEKAEKEAPEAKAPKAPKQEKFYKAVSAMVDLGLASSNPLQVLLIRLGLDAPGADGIDLRLAAFNCAVGSGGSAALSDVAAQAELLLSYLRSKAAASDDIQVPDGLEAAAEAAPEAAAA